MDRRLFLRQNAAVFSAPIAATAEQPAPAATVATTTDPPETVSRYANKALPKGLSRATSTLAPYTGPWGYEQAAHLLRRTLIGHTRSQVLAMAGSNLTNALNGLLTAGSAPAPPVNGFSQDTSVAVGQPWVTLPFNDNAEFWRLRSLRAWWVGQMLQSTTLVEKMTLFWHNHFVVEFAEVFESRYCYRYLALLRQHALGNVKQLAKDITIEPAMLDYLGGHYNRKGSPNENYARELFELFTVGKGPLIGPGNYTTYTEADVQAAAKVLTGWRDSSDNINAYFTATRHDTTTKQFSSAFGNQTIANQDDKEYAALVDMIFNQAETATFLCRKLYRWFVSYLIDQQVETDIIQPMVILLRQNNYNVTPVLRALLGSQHFFDKLNVGCIIKSPVEVTVGTARQLEFPLPPASNPAALYAMWHYFVERASVQQQQLGDPTNVAGWPAYSQSPQYNQLWINAVTLPRRNQLTDQIISANGVTRYFDSISYTSKVDVVALVQGFPAATAADCNLLIAEFARLLVPLVLTANQLKFLKGAMLPGLPDFEWTVEWTEYLATPTDAAKKTAVAKMLQDMLRALMGLAEYHLS